MKTSALVLAMGFALLSVTAVADGNAAFTAYEQGDYARALPLLSAQTGDRNPEVYFRLGQMYRNGWGVAQDASQAAQWYQKAADMNHSAALYNLAGMYHKGEGVTQSYATARGLATRAAELGYVKAGIYLGDVYSRGVGIPRDYQQAYAWLGLAGHDGDPIAIYNQAQIARLLSPEDRTSAERLLQGHLKARPAATAVAAQMAAMQNPVPSVATAVFPQPSPVGSSTPTLVTVNSVAATETDMNRVSPAAMVSAEPDVDAEVAAMQPAPAPMRTLKPVAMPVAAAPVAPVAVAAPALADAEDEPAPAVVRSQPPAALRGKSASRLHQVKAGETLWGIAHDIKERSHMSLPTVMASLKRENPGLSTKKPLKPGQWLQLPAFADSVASVQSHPASAPKTPANVGKAAKAAKAAPAVAARAAKPAASVVHASREIVVSKGDTLFSIAMRVRPSPATPISSVVSAIKAANPWILGPQSVRIGEHVRIPDFHALSDAHTDVTTGSL